MTVLLGMLADLAGWPGVAAQLSRDGVIEASNGRLEALVGSDVVGKSMLEFLDDGPTAEKWRSALRDGGSVESLEIIFNATGGPIAPRAFSILRTDEVLHLVEHPSHPRLAQMAADVEATNTDLVTAQRALVIERGRLAAALRELERSNRALDEFAHAVSHDLKAPLRAMKDSGEILGEDATTAEERRQHSTRVVELVGRMRRMIDGVFEYARAGRSRGDLQVIDTRRALIELVEYLGPPKTVEVVIPGDLPAIRGERVPFDQVFRNLLSNAFTYRRAVGARVEVSGAVKGDFVELAVSDNGPGIPVAQQARIWGLFHTSRPGEGTGIGLAVVKRLVEAQGGSIDVESAEGAGATFRVRWPSKAERPAGRAS